MAIRIWFTQAFSNGYAYISALRENWDGPEIEIIGSHKDEEAPMLQACDLVAPQPPELEGDAYADWAVDFVARHGISVMVARSFPVELARVADKFKALGCKVIIPSEDPEVLELLNDKVRTYGAASYLDLPLPDWRVADDHDSLSAAYWDLRSTHARVCMKPVVGIGAGGFLKLADRPVQISLEHLYDKIPNVVGIEQVLATLQGQGKVDPFMVLEFMPGNEYSIDCLAQNGELLHFVARSKMERHRWVVDRPDLVEYSRAVTRYFGLSGLYNLQFLDDVNGESKFLELNTRISGGIEQGLASGVDLVTAAVRLAVTGQTGNVGSARPLLQRAVPAFREIAPLNSLEPGPALIAG